MKRLRFRNLLLVFALAGASDCFLQSAHATPYTWTPTAASTTYQWDTATQSNWGTSVGGAFPNAAGDIANLNIDILGAQTIAIPAAGVTIGELNIGDAATTNFAYTVGVAAATNKITLDNGGAGVGTVAINKLAGASDVINAPIELNNKLVVTFPNSTGNLTFNGIISGNFGIERIGGATFNRVTLANAANSYTGDTTITSGMLRASATTTPGANLGPIPNGPGKGNVVIGSSGALELSLTAATAFTSLTINGLNGSVGSAVDNGTNASAAQASNVRLIIGNNDANGDYAGTIRNTASGASLFNVTKIGTGTQTFSGSSSYAGTTTVSNGTLIAGTDVISSRLGSTPVTSVTAATDVIALANHGFSNGDRVSFTAGTIPTGLLAATQYFVIDSNPNDFKVSTTSGGAAVNITAAGANVAVGYGVALDNTTNTIAIANHGLTNGSRVVFAGTLPPELSAAGPAQMPALQYYVVNASASDFQVSLTSGGTPIDFSTNGTLVTVAATGAFGTKFSPIVLGDGGASTNNVSLLAGTVSTPTIKVARDINVAANAGGTSTIGSSVDGNSVFSGTITLNKEANFTSVSAGGNEVLVSGKVTGPGTLHKVGTGTVNLSSAANDYTGHTWAHEGTLNLTGAHTYSGTGAYIVGFDAPDNAVVNISGNITHTAPADAYSFEIGTFGTGIVNQTGGIVTLGGAGGLLAIADDGVAGNGQYNLKGGTLDVTGTQGEIFKGPGIGAFNFTGGTLKVRNFNSTRLSGDFGGLTQSSSDGPSLLDVTGNSTTIRGLYALDGGRVDVGAAHTLTVLDGMTVGAAGVINGNGIIDGDVSVAGLLSVGNSIGQMDIDGNVVLTGTLLSEYDGNTETIDRLDVTGLLDLTAGTLNFADLGLGASLDSAAYVFASYGTLSGPALSVTNVPLGFVVNYSYAGNQVALVPVPEPGAITLVSIGLIGLGLFQRRRAK